MDPINLISHRATLKKVASTPGTTNSPPQVAVTLVYPMNHQTLNALGGLLAYVSHEIDTSLLARHFPTAPNPDDTPMDRELARVQREHGQEERMRPGPTETCQDCGNLIGEDPDAGFHVPLAGPPSPLCGSCIAKREAEDDDGEELVDGEPQAWCPVGEHWLVLAVGEVCQIHDSATFTDPESAAEAEAAAQPPADAVEETPVEDPPHSYCPACEAEYPFAPGGQCWTCENKTVEVPMPDPELLSTAEEAVAETGPGPQAEDAGRESTEEPEPAGARGRGRKR